MISLYWCNCRDKDLDRVIADYRSILPDIIVNKALSYYNIINSKHFIIGRIMLLNGLKMCGINKDLIHLRFSEHNRPFFDGGPEFSISHSGDFVVCAIATDCRVGVDIEKNVDIDISDFLGVFTAAELGEIRCTDPMKNTFFKYWTLKEAAVKADGRGLSIDLKSFDTTTPVFILENQRWFSRVIDFHPNYSVALITDQNLSNKFFLYEFSI